MFFNHFNGDQWVFNTRIITEKDRNIECPILMENINKNGLYCCCNKCKYNFLFEAFVKMNNNNDICPMCRSQWDNLNIYILMVMMKLHYI